MADALRTGLSAVEPLSLAQVAAKHGIGTPSDRREQAESAGDPAASPPAPEPEIDEPPAESGPAQEDPPRGQEDNDAAADDDQPPGDDDKQTDDADDPADEQPPIAPPRSWTKAEKEAFAALPREYQETILAREQTRERAIRQTQDQAAAAVRQVQSQWQAAQQARAQYEQGVQQISAQLAAVVSNEFGDIKSYDDVVKLARDDPYRHGQYQAAVQRAQAFQQEQQRISIESQQRAQAALQQFNAIETAKFLERAPEFADPKKASRLSAEVDSMLMDDYGLGRDEIAAIWSGQPVSPLDSRFRLILRDALLYRQGKTAMKPKPNPAPKTASPPPQRSSTPPAKGEVASRSLEKANMELTRTGSREAFLALRRARRSAGA